jgi:hypothetical protein
MSSTFQVPIMTAMSVVVLTLCCWVGESLEPVNVVRWLSVTPNEASGASNLIATPWSLEATTTSLQKPRWLLEIAVATMSAWAPAAQRGTCRTNCPHRAHNAHLS